MRDFTRSARLIPLLLCISIVSCDKKSKVTQPAPAVPLASLATIWPNADGGGWTYRLAHAEFDDTTSGTIFSTVVSVPKAPSMSALIAKFSGFIPPPAQMTVIDTTKFGLHFMGQITTGSGAVGQNLVESSAAFPAPAFAALGATGDPVLAQLWMARPDLRGLIAARGGSRLSAAPIANAPLFVHGYAWKRTTDAIIGYGDLDTFPAWRYLKRDIVAGEEFTQQLVPLLASDVLLHARVLGERTVQTPAGSFANAIVVFYEVDYGLATLSDTSGNVVGFQRRIAFGSVAYVDQVGPVACSERLGVPVGKGGVLGIGGSWNGLALLTHDMPRAAVRR